MKKRNISIGVAIAIVALLFAGTGIALAGEVNVDDFCFYQESMVVGTGLVMVDKDINIAPSQISQVLPQYIMFLQGYRGLFTDNLETNLHIHGCGDYEVDQVIKAVVVGSYKTPSGKFDRSVSQTIDYCEDAEMTFKPVTIKSGSMTLIDDDTSIKWKEDLCIKNYQINTAMRAKYTDADYIKKTIESNVTCVEPYVDNKDKWDVNEETAVPGYGIAKMDVCSEVEGASHVGVVVKNKFDPRITMVQVSEDYIGNFTIDKKMKVKMNKPWIADGDKKEWLPCPFGPTGDALPFYGGDS